MKAEAIGRLGSWYYIMCLNYFKDSEDTVHGECTILSKQWGSLPSLFRGSQRVESPGVSSSRNFEMSRVAIAIEKSPPPSEKCDVRVDDYELVE